MIAKKFIFAVMFIFLIGFASALDFDSIKEFKDNDKYGQIEVYNSILLFLKGDLIAEHELLEHHSNMFDAYSLGRTTLHSKDVLFNKFNFYDRKKIKGAEEKMSGFDYKVWEITTATDTIPTYTTTCQDLPQLKNGTILEECEEKQTGSYLESREVRTIVPYTLGQKLDAGLYEWKLSGERAVLSTGEVDWTWEAIGVETVEWATWWNSTFTKKRAITITENSATALTNYSVLLYVPYNTSMQADFDDLRFTNSTENGELGYYIENYTASTFAWVWVKVASIGSGSTEDIYMYYDNAAVGNNSAINDAYLLGDNFDSAVLDTAIWTEETQGVGATYVQENGLLVLRPQATTMSSANIKSVVDTFGRDILIEFSRNLSVGGTLGYIYTSVGSSYFQDSAGNTPGNTWHSVLGGGYASWLQADSSNTLRTVQDGSTTAVYGAGLPVNVALFYDFKMYLNANGTIEYIVNDTTKVVVTDTNYTASNMSLGISQALHDSKSQYSYIDYAKVRSYVVPEPTYSIGAEETASGISSTLVSPATAADITDDTALFNWTSTPTGTNLSNATISIWWDNGTLFDSNYSILSGNESLSVEYNATGLIEEGYLWNVESCATSDDCASDTNNFTFSVHLTAPTAAILTPSGSLHNITAGDNQSVTWVITEPGQNLTSHIANCSIEYNGTITYPTIAICTETNTTNIVPVYGDDNVYLNVTDEFGFKFDTSSTFDYNFTLEHSTGVSSITEGADMPFTLGFLTNSVDLTSANLTFNGSVSLGSATQVAYNFSVAKTLEAPTVTSATNLSYTWNITRTDGQTYTTASANITVNKFDIDNCSVNNDTVINFTIVDEEFQTFINGSTGNTTAYLDLSIYTSDRATLLTTFSENYTEINPFAVCLTSNLSGGETYSMDMQLQYDADGYAPEFYNIQELELDASQMDQSINLYDLADADAQEFQVTYKDENFLPISEALLKVQRKYISEGLFKTVEIPITDTNGETIAHLALSDVIYTFVLSKGGSVLATFDNVLAVCENVATGDCVINLNAVSSHVAPPDFTTGDDFAFTLSYDRDTREVSTIFDIPSGGSENVTLDVFLNDALGNTTACSDTLISSSGTLTCTVPSSFGNATVIARLYKDGNEQAFGAIDLRQAPSDLYGNNQVFLVIFLYLTLIGIGIGDNPMVTGVFLLVGAGLAIALNLVGTGSGLASQYFGGATLIWLFIAVVLIMIKGAKRT